jgi:uncharacterized damage-inducible protein DinB
MIHIIPTFLKELEQEAITTRKMLSLVPEDQFGWQPHPKSMTMLQLATHIAELPGWVTIAIETDEIDFAANPYEPGLFASTAGIVADFEQKQAEALASLQTVSETELEKNWTMRAGEAIYMVNTKAEVIRIALNQTTHHRAQLGVYLRLLNIPIPGSYGPSADEKEYQQTA